MIATRAVMRLFAAFIAFPAAWCLATLRFEGAAFLYATAFVLMAFSVPLGDPS